jgi:hypothetical protein
MKKFRTLLLTALATTALYYYTAQLCDTQTDGFSVARIHSALPYRSEWESPPKSDAWQEELKTACLQKFHYLGCGGQCFAFGSDDGKYVLKFFKHRIRTPYSFLFNTALPGPLNQIRLRKLDKALSKLNRDFSSYKIAYEELREETGLIYIHLNKGTALNQSVKIVDKLHIEHQIALDEVEFILQQKADLVHDHLRNLMQRGDEQKARKALHDILQVIVSRSQKGIYDEDAKIHRNFGFVGDKPIFIDVGRFTHDPSRKNPDVYKRDLATITRRLRSWLEENQPDLVTPLDEELYALQTQN